MASPDIFGASQLHMIEAEFCCLSFDLGVDVVAVAAPGRFAES